VGRAEELAAIAAARASLTGGVLLAGPAGVGKTRLAREVASRFDDGGATVRWVRATRSASGIPLGAFAPLLPAEELGQGGAQLRRAADALRADVTGDLVLAVDDVQFLDETSAALLLQLVVMNAAFIVATLRIGEDAPDAVVALWKDELVDRMDVRPLTNEHVVDLLQQVLGVVELSTAGALSRASGGNPLYLRELVAAAEATGTLHEVAGIWRLSGPLPTSPRLQELVSARLAELDGDERAAIELVAVSEPVGFELVEVAVGTRPIDHLERRGLLEVHRDGKRLHLRMAHAVYADVVRSAMTARSYREWCRMVADAVEHVGARRRDDKRRIAMWRLEAGAATDPTQMIAAAHDARVAADYPATERFARAALEAGGGSAAGLLLGEVLDELGRHDEAEAVLANAATKATDDGERTFIAVARADNLFRGLGRASDAERIAREVRDTLDDPVLVGEIDAQLATNLLLAGRVQEVLASAAPILAAADLRAYSQAALQAGMAYYLCGRYEDAVETATRAFEARVALGDQVQLADAGTHLVALSFAQVERGEIDLGIATAYAGYEGAAEARHRNGQAYFAISLARGHLLRGELETSARYAREAAVLFGEFNHPGSRWGFAALALALAQLGDVAGAEAAVADLDAEPETPVQMMDADIDRARAWVFAARGELPRARSVMMAAAERARGLGQHGLELAALFDLIRLGDASPPVRVAVAALVDTVQGELARLRLEAAEALATHELAALDAVTGGFERVGALLWAAEAANETAIAARAEGDPKRANNAVARSEALLERLEGARTPALLHGTGAAVLTAREREIAQLASQGQSSREIADALVVSPRTVENHLQRAYEKLGVRGRADLADALTRASL
jgi:DNA-binding CsgD family transcriptional regulator